MYLRLGRKTYLQEIQDFNTSINKQLQNRDRKANENILSVLNTQQTLRKYTKSVTKNVGCLSIALSLQAP